MIEWSDPPPEQAGMWRSTLTPVMGQPGRWALVRTYRRKPSAVDAVRQLRKSAAGNGHVVIPDGSWEFVQRQMEPARAEWGVWARYGGNA